MAMRIGAMTLLIVAWLLGTAPCAAGTIVFVTDFSSLSPEISGVATLVDVQDLAGLGTGTDVFGDDFLINGSGGNPAQKTTLELTNLPPHTQVSVGFLLAILETWDGLGYELGADYFHVDIDGVSYFNYYFGLVSGQLTNYPNFFTTLLGLDYYWGGTTGWRDFAFDMHLEPAFQQIPHTSSTLRIDWYGSGETYEGSANPELWGIDNLSVELTLVPEPSAQALALVAAVAIAWIIRRKH
ncbi:MAG: hypothetical protein K1X74_08770 [Pirellulales bacterium]|nr:hypothetical protein [Pirellulales bacterium]